jgi:septal ring factor EnvC (AmiA/AmiB activator)
MAITKIDKDLIDLMRLIEVTVKRNVEEWGETCEQYKNDFKFNKMRTDKYRLLDSIRSNARTLANKKREEEIVERRKQRNIEKLKAKERAIAEPSKRLMARSPPPALIKVVKKVVVDKEKLA